MLQLLDQRLDAPFRVAVVGLCSRGVGDGCCKTQLSDVVPATYFVKSALRFQIEVYDVDGGASRRAAVWCTGVRLAF
jgi:hypothetical protein